MRLGRDSRRADTGSRAERDGVAASGFGPPRGNCRRRKNRGGPCRISPRTLRWEWPHDRALQVQQHAGLLRLAGLARIGSRSAGSDPDPVSWIQSIPTRLELPSQCDPRGDPPAIAPMMMHHRFLALRGMRGTATFAMPSRWLMRGERVCWRQSVQMGRISGRSTEAGRRGSRTMIHGIYQMTPRSSARRSMPGCSARTMLNSWEGFPSSCRRTRRTASRRDDSIGVAPGFGRQTALGRRQGDHPRVGTMAAAS